MNNRRVYSGVALIAVIAISPWTKILFARVPITIFILTLLLSSIVLFVSENKKFLGIAVTINIILLFLTLPKNVDPNIFSVSRVEQDTTVRRFDYYGQDLGRLYKNRLGLLYHYSLEPIMHKYEVNLFENMDLNAYFFASHPRERGLKSEFIKFSGLFLPLFIVGFLGSLTKKKEIVILFGVNLVVSAFYFSGYAPGPLLLYPYLIFFITYGFRLCLEKSYLLVKKPR